MEQAQLFKYLFDMSLDEIASFIAYDETIKASLRKLDMAARTRHIIDAVQIEDMWQTLGAKSNIRYLHLHATVTHDAGILLSLEPRHEWVGVAICISALCRPTPELSAQVLWGVLGIEQKCADCGY